MVRQTITQALILVGGFGTRLHPLTLTTPKPLLPFMEYTLLGLQIQALVANGVKRIVLALHYKYENIVDDIKMSNVGNVDFIFSVERAPLGTAGPVALAKRYLKDGPFFVLNSDVVCDFPFADLENAFYSVQCIGVVLTTAVQNPERFGVIVSEEDVVVNFVEKPKNFVGNTINAGVYVFSPSIFNYIDAGPSSLEIDVFPRIAKIKMLRSVPLRSFWNDVGTPISYLSAQKMYIDFVRNKKEKSNYQETPKNDKEMVDCCNEEVLQLNKETTKDVKNLCDVKCIKKISNDIEKEEDFMNVRIFETLNVVVGKNVIVGENCIFKNCTIFENTIIGNRVVIENSIIGKGCILGDDIVIRNYSVVGDFTKMHVNSD